MIKFQHTPVRSESLVNVVVTVVVIDFSRVWIYLYKTTNSLTLFCRFAKRELIRLESIKIKRRSPVLNLSVVLFFEMHRHERSF